MSFDGKFVDQSCHRMGLIVLWYKLLGKLNYNLPT